MRELADILDTTGLFYYITMKEYERENRDLKIEQFRRIHVAEKKRLIQRESDHFVELLNLQSLKKFIPPATQIESYPELFQLLSKLPIEQCLNPQVSLDTFFPCYFIQGNYAWVSVNTDGHYRYFTKRKGHPAIGFDLLDIIEIVYKRSMFDALDKAAKLLSIQIAEDQWKKEQKEKYFSNYQFMSDFKQNNLDLDTATFLYLYKLLPVLDAINRLGAFHIHKKQYSYKEQNVFFASSSHLALHIDGFSSSKTAKMINLLAVLGFIEKVPGSSVPTALLAEALKIRDQRLLGNTIGFYIVHPFEEILPEIKVRAKKLMEYGVKYSNLTKSLIVNIFGSKFANTIYVQEVQKNKKQPKKKFENLHFQLEFRFKEMIKRCGYVTKSMVLSQPVEGYTEKQCKAHLNQIWAFLLKKYGCSYRKPDAEMKEKYGLFTFEYVAFKDQDY